LKNAACERDRQRKFRQKHPNLKKLYNKKCNVKRGDKSIVKSSKMKDNQDIEGKIQYCSVLAKVFQLSRTLKVILYIRLMLKKINKPPVCARLEAEQMIKWCVLAKKSYISATRKVFSYF